VEKWGTSPRSGERGYSFETTCYGFETTSRAWPANQW